MKVHDSDAQGEYEEYERYGAEEYVERNLLHKVDAFTISALRSGISGIDLGPKLNKSESSTVTTRFRLPATVCAIPGS